MTDKLRQAAEMALEALDLAFLDEPYFVKGGLAMIALRQALAEPDMGIDRGVWADVPNATKWVDELRGDEEPQRHWVGLKDEDMAEIRRNGSHSVNDADFRAIEAKLKQLNT